MVRSGSPLVGARLQDKDRLHMLHPGEMFWPFAWMPIVALAVVRFCSPVQAGYRHRLVDLRR
jgi:hypothetical protein